jgi:thiamine-phosphate pyrophosphorylase
MRFDFTPAAERALALAADWHAGVADSGVGPHQLLAALAAENDCRAAVMLAARGVDLDMLTRRWPELARRLAASIDDAARPENGRRPDFSREVREALREAAARVADYQQPLVLATEHLLLGLVAAPGEVGGWLVEQGLDVAELQAEIARIYGHNLDPLPIDDWDDEVIQPLANEQSGEERPSSAAADRSHGDARMSVDIVTVPSAACRVGVSGALAANLPAVDAPLLRLLDAAANRAREAIRVVEDFARFVLDDAHLTGELKRLRHELATALAPLPLPALLSSRDTLTDVGATIATPTEESRADAAAVVTANFKRLQEALRSLEEYGKIVSPHIGNACEALRYRAYTLERAVSVTHASAARIGHARLYVLIDGRSSLDAFTALAQGLIAAGVDVLQLRDKRLPDRDLLARARRLRELTAGTATLFIMNDRPDLAALAQADGVHVGQEELTVREARSIVGPDRLVGVSTHSIDQARRAVLDGADYIGVGPTFPSGTKHFDRFTGLELLSAVAAEIRLPAFAIGGITADNLPAVLATGIGRVATSGAVTGAAQPGAAARFLRQLLDAR